MGEWRTTRVAGSQHRYVALLVAGLVLVAGLRSPRLIWSASALTLPTSATAPLRPQTVMALPAQPLRALLPTIDAYLQTRAGPVGVAVIVPARGLVYLANGDGAFALASVVKVPIMLTLLDQLQRAGRELAPEEEALLQGMITASDNDAASTLWTTVGGGDGVDNFLQTLGLSGFTLAGGDEWGESTASPRAVGTLLALLLQPGLLAAPQYQLVLELLSGIVPEQRWGVSAGVPEGLTPPPLVGLKNGWYPTDSGWRLNSAGLVLPGDGTPGYALAILSEDQPDLAYGIETLETVATLVHAAMFTH